MKSIVEPLVRYNGEERVNTTADDEKFYNTLKERIGRFFKDSNISPTFSWQMVAKSMAILGGLGLSWFAAFMCNIPFALSFAASLAYGFFAAECGMSIMHDANH